MFDKITAAQENLRRLHWCDPSYGALANLFAAFQEGLEGLDDRIKELDEANAGLDVRLGNLMLSVERELPRRKDV